MNIWVIEILFGRLLVVLSTKSNETFLVQIADIRVNGRDQNVEPEIKFFVIEQ